MKIAEHPNGVKLIKVFDRTYSNQLRLVLPVTILNFHTEYLENNRTLTFCKCSFFDDYLGVGNSQISSRRELMVLIQKVMKDLLEKGMLLTYLKDKGFHITTWGAIAELRDYSLTVCRGFDATF